MKSLCTYLILFSIATFTAVAQPKISYIIPDIGAMNMNTYVEIIAPNSAIGTFGKDGLYLNNSSDAVRVECATLFDTNKIVIGPIVVSWNGRLISTQIFVRPTNPIGAPNSANWQNLVQDWRIPIKVFAGGQYSNVDTFYIVQPYAFGDKRSNAERVLGDGSLGFRSRRGAMLVDRMLLGDGTYTVSTKDCDPITTGNQGYLPCIILSKGQIKGTQNTIISVDAETNGTGNAGAGGGGGAGRFCDNGTTAGINKTDGGNGYTGGSAGGVNMSAVLQQNRSAQVGSSTGGLFKGKAASLNETFGGDTSIIYESGCGGTGHPFGTSGSICVNGANCAPKGGNGGGSGAKDNEPGGGGGFATIGNSAISRNNGGEIIGNSCIVPFGGGSGGASGNPQAFLITSGCSGEGGGGGGAISIYGYEVSNLQINSIGANGGAKSGTAAQTSAGGSGSGGGITLMSKTLMSNCNMINVSGGSVSNSPTGGAGRFRHDAPNMIPPVTSNFSGSLYRGHTTDTTTTIQRLATIPVSSNGQVFLFFLKPEVGDWILYDSTNGVTGTYNKVIDLTNISTYPQTRYYLVMMQRIVGPSTAQFTAEPDLVMSQAAANILRIADQPIIASDTVRTHPTIICPSDVFYDTLYVKNEGTTVLNINAATFKRGDQGFTLISPPQSSIPGFQIPSIKGFGNPAEFIVQYSLPPVPGVQFNDTLIIINNDPEVGKSPWKVSYSAQKDSVAMAFLDLSLNAQIDTVDFGKVCIGPSQEKLFSVSLLNRSPLVFTVNDLILADQSNFSAIIPSITIPIGSSKPIDLKFKARSRGKLETRLIAKINKCGSADTLVILAEGIETNLSFTGTGQFSNVKVGDTKQITIILKNEGSEVASLQNFPVLPAPFRIVTTIPSLPIILPAGGEVVITVEYAPTIEGDDSAALVAVSLFQDGGCSDTAKILLAGKAISSQVNISKPSLDYGLVPRCETKLDSVQLMNTGIASLIIGERAVITGTNASAFSIGTQPQPPITLNTNDIAVYTVLFSPNFGVSGLNTAILTIKTDDPKNPRIDIPISAISQSVQVPVPTYLNGGTVPINSTASLSFPLTNNGGFTARLKNVISTHSTVNPTGATIGSTGTVGCSVNFLVKSAGIVRDSLFFVFDQPCIDTQLLIIEVTGIEAALSFRNELNFGDVASCETRVDTVSYSNTGTGDLTITQMAIQGIDAGVFRFGTPLALPFTLVAGTTVSREVIFDPLLTTDGPKTAQVITKAIINGVTTDVVTLLRGERRSAILAAPEQITFGGIETQSTVTQPLTLKNNGTQTIVISGSRFSVGGNDFTATLEPPLTYPLTLAPGDIATLLVTFAPILERSWVDTLRFTLMQPCADERLVIVTGTGLPSVRTVVRLPIDTSVSPTAIDYEIPIVVSLNPPSLSLRQVSFTAEFECSKQIFLPLSVSRGKLTSTINPISGKRNVVIDVSGIDVTAATPILVRVRGNALLGSIESDSLTWKKFRWTAGTTAQVDSTIDGYLALTLCDAGGKRLISDTLKAFGLSIVSSSNSRDVSVSVATVELGKHTIEILNTNGQLIYSNEWEEIDRGNAGVWKEIPIESAGLSSGMYVAVFKTPTKIKTEKIVIVR
ncbi:MAG: choice-of-anchor D domain-containing protein [Ignavibacteria bacterium]|nr:choice-of-anchor D domain-containing protein [Ignavibacteria bacterium]